MIQLLCIGRAPHRIEANPRAAVRAKNTPINLLNAPFAERHASRMRQARKTSKTLWQSTCCASLNRATTVRLSRPSTVSFEATNSDTLMPVKNLHEGNYLPNCITRQINQRIRLNQGNLAQMCKIICSKIHASLPP